MVPAFGPDTAVIDLDDDRYFSREDVVGSAE
jgi:hypothetical protein